LLLDLHGQATDKDTIFRGTNDLKSVKDLQTRFGKKAVTGPNSILGVLEKKGYTIFPANEGTDGENKKYNGGYITSHYGSSNGTGIDAIQFETGGDHRAKANLDKTAADFAAAIKVFAKEYLPAEKQPSK
jgi:N-formylglutamate amidohydrolase